MNRPPDHIEPGAASARPGWLGFLRRLGVLVGIALGLSVLAALAVGQFNPTGISNNFFWAAFILLAIAAIPIFSEIGSGVSLIGRAAAERKDLRSLMEGEKEKRDQGARRSILYGLAGILLFLLSFVASSLTF